MLLRRYHGEIRVIEPEKAPHVEEPTADEELEVVEELVVELKDLPVYDEVTKADIRQLLDEQGIAYDNRANKSVLYDLLAESE